MHNRPEDRTTRSRRRDVAAQDFSVQAAYWWGARPPRLLLHASVLYALLFYVVPLHVLLAQTAPYWPFFRGRLASVYRTTGINVPFLIAMLLAYCAVYLVVYLAMQIIEVRGELETEAGVLAGAVNYSNGLTRLQALIVISAVVCCAVALATGIGGLAYLLLGGAVIVGLTLGSRNPVAEVAREEHKDQRSLLTHIRSTEQELASGEGVVQKTYTWYFNEHPYSEAAAEVSFTITVPVSGSRYEDYAKRSHEVAREADYAGFVLEGLTPEVALVGDHLRHFAQERHYSSFQTVSNAFAFTRQFHYAYDHDSKGVAEYPRYPIEMLWDEEGDCECHAILAAALLKYLGFDVVLFAVDFEKGPGHIAVGVAGAEDMRAEDNYYARPTTGVRYFYCEATPAVGGETDKPISTQWHIGRLPFDDVTRIRPIPLRGFVMGEDEEPEENEAA